MSLYQKLFEAYRSCYCHKFSKQKVQANANELWKSLKDNKSEFPINVESKIKELLQEKTKKDVTHLSFFTKQVKYE